MRICFFGDSIVNGTGDPDCLGWVGRVCAAARQRGIDVTSYNLGIRRDTSADILRRWRQEADIRLPAEYPRRLVFSFGVNDRILENGECRVQPGQTIANARAILSAAAAYAPTLMIGPAPLAETDVNHRVQELIPDLRTACNALHVPFLDVFDRLKASSTWMREITQGDGAHPGRGGYQEFAVLVNGWPEWRAWLG
ncbi:MAG TPA: GDSL-type esterase/lipase family protein [Xanthobacteraceae bacterium]|jgi:lysophospholipase L1-like esterase